MISEYQKIKILLKKEKEIILELEKSFESLKKTKEIEEKTLVNSQIKRLKVHLKKITLDLKRALSGWSYSKPLDIKKAKKELEEFSPENKTTTEKSKLMTKGGKLFSLKEILPVGLEKETIERIKKSKKREKVEDKKKENAKKTKYYSKISSQFFSKLSLKLLSKNAFIKMQDQLLKASLDYTPIGYTSIIIMTTFLSVFVAGFLFLFFLFFNFSAAWPIVTRATESIDVRFLKTFWILFLVPLATFLMMYVYPSTEKKNAESRINEELPFATINMAAISGSLVNPIKIFEILISTNEYPFLKREFTKMINEINLYGYDLVSALKNTSKNSPSKKLSELLNGLVTTISSGGNLPKFFDERAQTLLFNYRLDQEKAAKAAETMMDVYISILIASPMILMLLLIIMKISGIGLALSLNLIAILIIGGVVVANIIFLTFLHLRRDHS